MPDQQGKVICRHGFFCNHPRDCGRDSCNFFDNSSFVRDSYFFHGRSRNLLNNDDET